MHQPSKPRRRKRRWPWVLLGLLAVAVVLGIDLAWAGSNAYAGFTQARKDLSAGGAALQSGDIAEARDQFGAATSDAAEAHDALGHPSVSLVGWLPWFHNDVDAARRGATALDLAARGGTSYVEAAEAIGWDGSSVPGFSPGGHINAAAIQRAQPSMTQAADLVGQANAELQPVNPGELTAPLDRLVAEAQTEIRSRASQASIASDLTNVLPSMLGADGPRTYLLVTLSPSDPRGSGGYPGVYGLLHVDGHQLSLSDLAATSEIPKVSPVPGPADVKKAWGWAGIDRIFWDTTYTPDFPTAARFMKEIWEKGGGQKVDGVITGDPSFMAAMLSAVGPVETPAWPDTITTDNVERIVGADVYRTTSSTQSDAWQVGIGAALWQAVLTRPWPVQQMATAMSTAASGGHIRVWSKHIDEEASLSALGVTGAFALPAGGGPVVTLTGFTNNRAGYFSKRTVQVGREVDDHGQPVEHVSVTVANRAPTRPKSILLGINPADVGGKPIGT